MNTNADSKFIDCKLEIPEIPPDADHLETRTEQMRRYFDTIFRDGSGWLHLAIGCEPYINAKGKYEFHNFAAISFPWPDPTINEVIDFLLKESEKVDIYVCPYLMQGDRRAKGMAVDHRWLHSDIDREPFDFAKAEKLDSIGGFAIESGSPDHVHAYVPLSDSVPIEQHEALCIGLGNYLGGADSKISDNDVLRLPGTFNHKPRVRDGKPIVPVRWLS
jgi:hypothetical protein